MAVTVSAFYRFTPIADCAALGTMLAAHGAALGIRGTVLLAPEGINGTISGTDPSLAGFFGALCADPRFAGLETKYSAADAHPFRKLKVKLRPEIVTYGVTSADPSRAVGTYVAPADWNALVSDPDVLLIDTRNTYEVAVGTFAGAIDPGTRTFGEFPAFVRDKLDPARHPKVAMFCTGGIRCEKATAHLKSLGFRDVYHLAGGILKYLETVPAEQSLWRGACFVFDDRVAVGHGLAIAPHRRCDRCGQPVPASAEARTTATHPGTLCADCAG